jgi:hypothetical protein
VTLRIDPETGAWQFPFHNGWRTLSNPDGPPTARQLLRLAHLGLLEIRDTPGGALTKLDAALAIDEQEETAA